MAKSAVERKHARGHQGSAPEVNEDEDGKRKQDSQRIRNGSTEEHFARQI